MAIKPTLKTPTSHGENFEKNFSKTMNINNVNLNETDVLLNEKEQSLKKKIFDLSKMESLVHSDEKLSAIYNDMSEEGEEMYGYHYNETIMNMIFNDHILNSPQYLQKYKSAIPKEKKRRDKSGIHKLQVDGEKEMNKKNSSIKEDIEDWENNEVTNTPNHTVTVDQSNDREQLENRIKSQYNIVDETTSAGGSAGAANGDSRADGYSYVGPFGDKRNKDLDKPIWKGGDMVVNENYLTDPTMFKNYLTESIDLEQDFASPNNDSLVSMAENKKLNEENYHRLRKIEYYDTLGQKIAVDDLENGTVPENELSTITDKPVILTFDDNTTERVTFDEFNRLYSNDDDVDMDVVDKGDEKNDVVNSEDNEIKEESMIDDNPTSMKLGKPIGDVTMSSVGGIGESVGNLPEDEMYVEYYKDYPTESDFIVNGEKYRYIYAKYADGKIDLGVYSYKGDITYGYKWFRKQYLNINESVRITEDGHCRKDEIPVTGKVAGEKGSCKKKNNKNFIDPEERKRSPNNIKQREKRLKNVEMEKNRQTKDNIKVKNVGSKINKKVNESTDLDKFENVVFMQDEEANEPFNILNNQGEDAAMNYLKQWHDYGNHEGSNELKHGTDDKTYEKDGYIMSWNPYLKYIGLDYNLEKDKFNVGENNELDVYEKELNEMKKDLKTIVEDRRPSSLVNLDRLKKQNGENFSSEVSAKTYLKDTLPDDTMHNDLINDVKDPQKLGQDIEKEKLKDNKGESFDNVGDSTNENNKEIPKRNYTEDEAHEVDMMRQGMQDITYDVKPSEKFEDRMKDDMGETLYKQRQDKMDYKAEAPMYNKDTQPIDDGENVKQFDKNKSKYNSNKVVDENYVFTGKYKNLLNQTKFVNFKNNEIIKINENDESMFKINLDGLGNRYTQSVNENFGFNKLKKNNYYTDGNNVYLVINKRKINESKTTKKGSESNIDLNKMKNLMNYKPSNFIDINNIKKNRGF